MKKESKKEIKEIMKGKKSALFIIDSSVLVHIIEGKKEGKSLIDKIMLIRKETGEKNLKGITTLACLLRAIWMADKDTKIEDLQKIIEVVSVCPSIIDYKNEEAVRTELIEIANELVKKGKGEK